MAWVLKRLVSRSSSVIVPYLRRPPNHPRPFSAASESFLERFLRRNISPCLLAMAPDMVSMVLRKMPHTLRVTSRVAGIGGTQGLSGGDEDVTLGTSMKFSLHVPGIEKITETPENLYIFIDMGLPKNWVCDDLDVNAFSALLCNTLGPNMLLVEGYLQKLDIRRHYTCVVCLPPNIKAAARTFMVLPENGGVVVTIPKLVTGSSCLRLLPPPTHLGPPIHPRPPSHLDAARSFLGLTRKKVRFTVDFITVNREVHGRFRLAVQDREKKFRVFIQGVILTIVGDDVEATKSVKLVPTYYFKPSEVTAIRGRDDIIVIFPLTTEVVEHDLKLTLEVPFV